MCYRVGWGIEPDLPAYQADTQQTLQLVLILHTALADLVRIFQTFGHFMDYCRLQVYPYWQSNTATLESLICWRGELESSLSAFYDFQAPIPDNIQPCAISQPIGEAAVSVWIRLSSRLRKKFPTKGSKVNQIVFLTQFYEKREVNWEGALTKSLEILESYRF